MKIIPTLVLDVSDSVSKAVDEVLRTGTAVLVVKEGKYYGMVDNRHLRSGLADLSRMKCEHVAVYDAPTLSEETPVYDQVQAFLSGHFKALPVLDARARPRGITTRTDLLAEFLEENLLPSVEVGTLMHGPLYTIDSNKTVADAKSMMKDKKAHRLIVVEKGRPQGIFSTFDLVSLSSRPQGRRDRTRIPEMRSRNDMCIGDIVRKEIETVEATDTLPDAARRMAQTHQSTLLVREKGRYAGVIAASDIFEYLLHQAEAELPVTVAGLGEAEQRFVPQVREALQALLSKFSRSFKFQNVAVRFKKGKSVYSAHLSLRVSGRPVSLAAEEHDVKTTINRLADELYSVLHKQKEFQLRRRHRGERE